MMVQESYIKSTNLILKYYLRKSLDLIGPVAIGKGVTVSNIEKVDSG